jgi:hypothetical protein
MTGAEKNTGVAVPWKFIGRTRGCFLFLHVTREGTIRDWSASPLRSSRVDAQALEFLSRDVIIASLMTELDD